MLGEFKVVATIPVTDLDRAKTFYSEKLGFRMTDSNPFAARFACGGGSELSLFKRAPSKADHTVAHFEIDDIEKTVAGLRARGVTFLEYDPEDGQLHRRDRACTRRLVAGSRRKYRGASAGEEVAGSPRSSLPFRSQTCGQCSLSRANRRARPEGG